jgi:hypothetical protein
MLHYVNVLAYWEGIVYLIVKMCFVSFLVSSVFWGQGKLYRRLVRTQRARVTPILAHDWRRLLD